MRQEDRHHKKDEKHQKEVGKKMLKVKDIMNTHPVTITKEINMYEAAKLMSGKKLGSLVVVEGNVAIGIITERDILNRLVAKNSRPEDVKVEEIMTTDFYSITSDRTVVEANKIMSVKDIRRLPVIEDDKLIGMISATDLLRQGL